MDIAKTEHYVTSGVSIVALSLDLSSVFFSLWKLLQTEHSYLATLVVPLLLHCMTLTTGASVLWHLVENDFPHDDWKVRFGAGKRNI